MASFVSTPPRIRRMLCDDPTTPILPSLAALHVADVVAPNNVVLPPCLSLDDAIISASTHIWDVPLLRPIQLSAVSHIINRAMPNKLLLVARTGIGKTHVTRIAGVILRGIVLIIIPLLSLSADQIRNVTQTRRLVLSMYIISTNSRRRRTARDKSCWKCCAL
jgi:superfamily II DNA helicase RecQ